jgi:hypothetical protein
MISEYGDDRGIDFPIPQLRLEGKEVSGPAMNVSSGQSDLYEQYIFSQQYVFDAADDNEVGTGGSISTLQCGLHVNV